MMPSKSDQLAYVTIILGGFEVPDTERYTRIPKLGHTLCTSCESTIRKPVLEENEHRHENDGDDGNDSRQRGDSALRLGPCRRRISWLMRRWSLGYNRLSRSLWAALRWFRRVRIVSVRLVTAHLPSSPSLAASFVDDSTSESERKLPAIFGWRRKSDGAVRATPGGSGLVGEPMPGSAKLLGPAGRLSLLLCPVAARLLSRNNERFLRAATLLSIWSLVPAIDSFSFVDDGASRRTLL